MRFESAGERPQPSRDPSACRLLGDPQGTCNLLIRMLLDDLQPDRVALFNA
jgi:hypothetical protein